MSKKIQIYTDGSSRGNPGPGGYGVVATVDDTIIDERGGYERDTTNNRMELKAVIEAIGYLLEEHPDAEAVIHADSAYVLGGVTTWIHSWEKNGWKTSTKKAVLNQDLWQALIALIREFKGSLSWQKVKGHAGHVHNERADVIATTYADFQKHPQK
jgi:ribonuclease HI